MLGRCRWPSHTSWKWYGAKGVKVCERWQSFENFIADMGQPPFLGATIERRNNDGNYEPANCCWASQTEQIRNRSNTVRLSLNGITKSLAEWADEIGLTQKQIWNRRCKGWSDERILTQPIK